LSLAQMGEIKQILGTAQDGSRITGETAYSVLHVPVTVQTAIILGVTAAAEVGFGVLSWFIYKVSVLRWLFGLYRQEAETLRLYRTSAGRLTRVSPHRIVTMNCKS
jgi:hypothetical protein